MNEMFLVRSRFLDNEESEKQETRKEGGQPIVLALAGCKKKSERNVVSWGGYG